MRVKHNLAKELVRVSAQATWFDHKRSLLRLGFKELEELKKLGSTETGELFEQKVEINYEGKPLTVRRVVLKLFVPTRDKEWEIAIFSNLPDAVPAAKIGEIYGNRWSIENLFQTVTENFNGEIQTLGYPKAALFSFSIALVTYNILATLRAALEHRSTKSS